MIFVFQVQVYEISYGDSSRAFVSPSGEITKRSTGNDDKLKINGLYAYKLGIKDEENVRIDRLLNNLTVNKTLLIPIDDI